ncbi:alpha/beta fold hydrolase [Nocardioides sp. CN2-186]|uniref:alpha/beta fold hydrolase n=1 Tax=Nocardioides tweenelious TaxID=3156607 RepID=UPI0032B5A9AD
MDLVPKPDQVVAAAGNLGRMVLHRGVADLRPMPRTQIDAGPRREVFLYEPSAGTPATGEPVLLVAPLAAPATCFDLRRGCSLVEHLVEGGRPTYLVEYGAVSLRNRDLGLDPWVDKVVPDAVRTVSEHAGGKPVHVVGWGLGGIFALLAAAASDLPIASLSVLGSPVDVTQVPMLAPARPLLADVPAPLRWVLPLVPFRQLVDKQVAVATHLDDTEWLAQVEAVDRFTAATTPYRGRAYGQLYHRFALGDRVESFASVTAPVLVVAGATDGIAPVAAVRPVLPLLTGAREVRFEIVPGGHLGLLTGRGARASTWPVLDEWFEQWSAAVPAPKKRAAKKAPAKKKAPAAKKAAPSADVIGANPKRRHSSASSRALSR